MQCPRTTPIWFGVVILAALVVAPRTAAAQADAGSQPDAAHEAGRPAEAETTGDAGSAFTDEEICRKEFRGFLSQILDAGEAEVRKSAREACADGGLPEMSQDEAIDTITDDIGPVVEEESGCIEYTGLAVEIGFLLIVGIAVWIRRRRRDEKYADIMDAEPAAFEGELAIGQLRANPERVDEIADEIDEIYVMRIPASEKGGSYGGPEMTVSYAAFVVDSNDETHEFSRGEDWAAVQEDAKWLADRVGVEVRDESYG